MCFQRTSSENTVFSLRCTNHASNKTDEDTRGAAKETGDLSPLQWYTPEGSKSRQGTIVCFQSSENMVFRLRCANHMSNHFKNDMSARPIQHRRPAALNHVFEGRDARERRNFGFRFGTVVSLNHWQTQNTFFYENATARGIPCR